PELDPIYGVAAWAATLVGLIFIAGYVARVATEQRRMMQALHTVEATLRREQQVSAVGALAAAAAHELGTPLATITLVAKELSLEIPEDTDAGKDIALLVSQTERCRAILADLTARTGDEDDDTGARFYPISLSALIEEIGEDRTPEGKVLTVLQRPIAGDAGAEPRVLRAPELVNGLINIISNALQFAHHQVSVSVAWSAKNVSITVVDDGPGFSPDLLERIGDPYISTRKNEDGHMGLGLFIARTLLENSRARLTFGNRSGAGAEITASWSRADLEAELKE
ncbi:MAG: ATP-binding protein, partial [Rhodospirillales bacterium]